MLGANNSAALVSGTVVDEAGEKIGTVGDLFVDPASGQPNWITVKTGFFGTSKIFVPLDGADAEGETVRVPYAKNFVKDAPRVDSDGPLGHEDERRLYDYYGSAEGTGHADPTDRSDIAADDAVQTSDRSDIAADDAVQTSDPAQRPDTAGDGADPTSDPTVVDAPCPHGRHVRTAPPS